MPNVDRFSTFFCLQSQQYIVIKFCLKIPPDVKCITFTTLLHDLSLIATYVSDFYRFSEVNISQGNALTHLKCCEIFLWPPCVADADITFCSGFFFFLSFFPHLISVVADWISAILPHMVWL